MARTSLESAQSLVDTILNEQQHDRKILQGMLDHSVEMVGALKELLEQEQEKIDAECQERKASVRKMFRQLISNEEERSERMTLQLTELAGEASAPKRPQEAAKIDEKDPEVSPEVAAKSPSGNGASVNVGHAH